ncbi:MAG: hypothetical protein AB4040_13815 [Synechococcus sp.]
MRRLIKDLEFILEQQLQPYNCLAEVRQKGPILEVLVRHIPGELPEAAVILSIINTGLDAAFAPDIQKVNVFALPIRDRENDPQRVSSFAYERSPDADPRAADEWRQDYLPYRLTLLILGVIGITAYAFNPAQNFVVASLSAIGIALIFNPCKRIVERTAPFLQRLIVLAGSFAVGMAIAFLVQGFPTLLGMAAVALVFGISIIMLGWR